MSAGAVVHETIVAGAPPPTDAEDRLMLQAMDAALHDLSQPLTTVALAMEVLAREQDPSTVEALLVAAREECARAMRDVEMLRVQTNRLLNHTKDAQGGRA